MAIKFPKLSRKEEEYDDFYPDYDEVDDSDDDIKINEVEEKTENDRGAFSGINESAVSLKLMTPKESGDARKVADCLLAGSSVVLNIENLKNEEVVRFLDFLFGVIYVINGNMKHVSKTTIIVTPNNVGVEGEGEVDLDI